MSICCRTAEEWGIYLSSVDIGRRRQRRNRVFRGHGTRVREVGIDRRGSCRQGTGLYIMF